jgi:hypothetical protein
LVDLHQTVLRSVNEAEQPNRQRLETTRVRAIQGREYDNLQTTNSNKRNNNTIEKKKTFPPTHTTNILSLTLSSPVIHVCIRTLAIFDEIVQQRLLHHRRGVLSALGQEAELGAGGITGTDVVVDRVTCA